MPYGQILIKALKVSNVSLSVGVIVKAESDQSFCENQGLKELDGGKMQ